jgi:RNA polymerase sigma-70 factor (ECF subfamily)
LREFERAVRVHQRSVFTFARYLLGSQQEAEDVAQEALLRMWRHWDNLDGERLEAWLMQVTRNLCYDQLRRVRAKRNALPETSDETAADRVASEELDPEQEAHGRALGSRLVEAVRELREPYRSAIILREIQGLSYREIGEALDVPLNSVKVHVYRGRRMLRETLREEELHVATS